MSGWQLTLKAAPALRLDLAALLPEALAALDAAGIAQLRLAHGREWLTCGDVFDIAPSASDGLTLIGDLSRCDRIGHRMAAGTLRVVGDAGHQLGLQMSGGLLRVEGSAREQAAVELSGGSIEVTGNLGDWAASALPGSQDGMRGGALVVHGHVGARCADRLRRGLVAIGGDAGDFLASRLVAGTVALAGRCGAHPGYLMRRGSVVFAGAAPAIPATYVPSDYNFNVAWALIARDIERSSGLAAFTGLAQRTPQRWVGDRAADGRGEWFTF